MKVPVMKSAAQTVKGQAGGKLILIGEHAVVYGQPAIAVPFDCLKVTAEILPTDGPLSIDCRFYSGPVQDAPDLLKGIVQCAEETIRKLDGEPFGIMIRLTSDLPLGRGLGSSAAVACAIVRGLYRYFGKVASHDALMALVNISEVFAHGTPSGLDAEAVASEHAIWFRKGEKPLPIPVAAPMTLVVADSGLKGDTFEAVKSVKTRLQSAPERMHQSFSKLGVLAEEARRALSDGAIAPLGRIFNEAQDELANIGVSHEKLDHLIKAAREAGALGAKLTGSGKGGCLFALARDVLEAKKIRAALLEAGACDAWLFTIRKDMLR